MKKRAYKGLRIQFGVHWFFVAMTACAVVIAAWMAVLRNEPLFVVAILGVCGGIVGAFFNGVRGVLVGAFGGLIVSMILLLIWGFVGLASMRMAP